LVAIKTLLSRDPCVHANTAIEMIDAILKEHPAAQPAPVQEPYAWHYKNAAGVSAWHFGPSRMFDADLEASKMWPRTHQLIPVYTENRRSISDCEELAALGWQAITCPSCGNVGARGYPRNAAPPAQPAVPDAFGTREGEHPEYIQGWNDCRAEMLSMRKRVKP
jgi:hypothetical protein